MLARVWSNRNSYTAGRNKQAQDKKNRFGKQVGII